jgi:phage-related protein (TIGR01555 family)
MFDFLKRWRKPQDPRALAMDAAARFTTDKDALHAMVELQRQLIHMKANDGLQNVAAGLGTNRDKRSFTGYGFVEPLQYSVAETYYRSNWLCKNIVDVRGTDMVREWYDVQWDGKDDDKDRQQQVDDAMEEFAFEQKFLESTLWARLYGGSAMIFGIKGQDPTEPLDVDTLGEGCLEYVHVFDRWRMSATELMDKGGDLPSPNFLKPRFYVLGGSEAEAGVRVHWSRVLVFDGRHLPYRSYLQNAMWGDSELQHVIEDVKDYSSVMALLATMFFEANVDVMMIANLAQTLAMPKGSDKINARFNIAATQKSANRMLMMDAQDRYEKKGNNFSGLGAIVEDFRANVCAAAQTPDTKLFGRSPGGLNATGESDDQNYRTSVVQAQKSLLSPQVKKGLKILCMHRFGKVPPNFHITPRPLFTETAGQKSQRLLQNAQRDQIYVELEVLGRHTVAKQLKEDKVYGALENAEVNMVKDLEEAATEAQMQEAQKQALFLKSKKTGESGPPKPPAP